VKRENLADEIRGAGAAVRFADGPVLIMRRIKGKPTVVHSWQGKLKVPDEEIIRMAATCSTCDAAASAFDIEFASDVADCYRSFARLIWPCIDHEEGCEAEPYLPVHEGSQKDFAKVKAEFEKRRREREERLATTKAKRTVKKAAKTSKGVKKKAAKAKKTPKKKKS
jgi:hypothetical protein